MIKYLLISFVTLICCDAQVVMNAYRFGGIADLENNNLLPQLLAFYSLDETSGHAIDSNTNAYHLAEYGGNPIDDALGQVDGARKFTSGNSFYTNSATWANFDTNEFTITFWFRPSTNFYNAAIISCGDISGTFSWGIFMYDFDEVPQQQHLIFLEGSETINALDFHVDMNEGTPTNAWHFGFLKRTGDIFTLGIANPGSDTISVTDTIELAAFDLPFAGAELSIGSGLFTGSPIEEWDGDLDHVGIWLRALSDCELLKLLRLRKFSQFDSDACN